MSSKYMTIQTICCSDVTIDPAPLCTKVRGALGRQILATFQGDPDATPAVPIPDASRCPAPAPDLLVLHTCAQMSNTQFGASHGPLTPTTHKLRVGICR